MIDLMESHPDELSVQIFQIADIRDRTNYEKFCKIDLPTKFQF